MEVGRVTQSDAVEGEIVRVRKNQNAWAVLILIFYLGFLGEIPPGYVLAGEFLTAAAIDYAIAHNCGVGDVDAGDDRLAAVTGLIDYAAASGSDVVLARVEAGVEGCFGIDEECDSGAELEGTGEECSRGAFRFEFDGLAWRALV